VQLCYFLEPRVNAVRIHSIFLASKTNTTTNHSISAFTIAFTMNTDPPSPCKVAKGDGPFLASLFFDVHKMNHSNSGTLNSLKPPDHALYSNTDILAPLNGLASKNELYIFNPTVYIPSSDKLTMKAARNKLQGHLKLKGKMGDGDGGSNYFFDSLKQWGPNNVAHHVQPMKFYLKCFSSVTARESSNAKMTEKSSFKLAGTNNTRGLHGRFLGNKEVPRKSCKY